MGDRKDSGPDKYQCRNLVTETRTKVPLKLPDDDVQYSRYATQIQCVT